LEENKEITALLHLIDDPDEDVYNAVSNKIVSFGKEIIPALEHFWENVTDNETQERIEMLIHRLHFSDLRADFVKWKSDTTDILSGTLLVAKYAYPDMDVSVVLKEIEKLRRNIWLEMNSYLTPLEQINVINSIFYNYYKQRGTEISYENPDGFLLNKVLESRKGNAFGNGVAYLVLCSLLDVPVRAIGIPKQFILGYFDIQYDVMNPSGHSSEKIKFYIDPVNGQMYSHKDVENYFKKLSVPPVSSYFRPLTNKVIVQYLLEELGKCYDNNAQQYKVDELREIINLLDE
jgi:regulator of sirC expression with transglutaminase-like and TPR domain